ncbi:MAG: polysaccharide biosynthesis/export family protein, partial [Cytophagales bacterium]|nr:polysaccharide biosynthesis/export family protein [Cytophagales bacterium]
IDLDGTIDLPEAGKIEVAGLSVNQAQELVKNTLQPYLSNASILLKLVSFKITVLGEVNNPGYYFIYNDQATLLEGLGLAGDLTDFGNRENITIIRQVDEGSEAILVNLKDPKVLASEYYYLKPNDVVYVQPLKAKNTRNNLNTFTLSSIVFGAVSSTLLILSYLDDN